MKKSTKLFLWVVCSMYINLLLGFAGLFAYWGWPDFPSWAIADRRGWLFCVEVIPLLIGGGVWLSAIHNFDIDKDWKERADLDNAKRRY